jgi:hypothetical protein
MFLLAERHPLLAIARGIPLTPDPNQPSNCGRERTVPCEKRLREIQSRVDQYR